jgi:Ca-activated chloride channel family protein
MVKQMIRIWWLWTVLFLLLCGGLANAEPAARMVLVLDASGSMWGQIEGKAKIQIAKEVMGELVAAVPQEFHTGLMVYGHRRKGDCRDIEMMIPVGRHDASAMKAKIEAISPKGKTPLSESVRQAAEALRYTEEQATVVLVSDGLETCDIDPCALAAELAMSGVDFTVHVIGFDIGKEDQGRLSCLAEKTGGLFLAADNAGSLRDALFQTLKEVQAPPPPVVEDPGTAQLTGPASVPAGSTVTVQWDGPDSRNDYVGIAEKDAKTLQVKEYAYTKLGNPSVFPAPGKVGDYDLVYVHGRSGKVIGRTDITVTPVEAAVHAPEAVDVAVTFDVQWQGPDYNGDYLTISREDQPPSSYLGYAYTSQGSPLKLRAPSEPGVYEVRYIMGKGSVLLAKTAIEIKGVGATIEAPAVADVATQFEVAWTGPGNEPDYIAIASPDQQPGEYRHYTYTSAGSPLKLQAPAKPGNYEVRYILGSGKKLLAKAPIAIKAVSASVQAPEEVDAAAVFEVSWQGPGNDKDYITIAAPDQKPGEYRYYTYTRTGSPLKLQAPSDPGSYEVRYILGHGNELLAKTPVTIKAVSAAVQAPEEVDAAAVFEVSWQGPGNDKDYITIAAPDQKPGEYRYYTYTRTGSPLKLQAPSDPGSYEVRYILGQGNKLLANTPITISPVNATVTVAAVAAVDSSVEIAWEGPGYIPDYICISKPGDPPGKYLGYTFVKTGNPLKVKAPKDPGVYEVRYILGQGKRLLDKKVITVE